METLEALQRARLRELLARLDRIATVSRGHRAGLHLYDYSLFEQYLTLLVAWEREAKGQSIRPVAKPLVSVDSAVEPIEPPLVALRRS